MGDDDGYEPSQRPIPPVRGSSGSGDEGGLARARGTINKMTGKANRGTSPPSGKEQEDAGVDARQWANAASLKGVAREVVAVRVYDVDSTVGREQPRIAATLEAYLNAIGRYAPAPWRHFMKEQGFRFLVGFVDGEPDARAKAATGPATYPLYVLSEGLSTRWRDTLPDVIRIMDEHGIPPRIGGYAVPIRSEVESDWSKPLRGVAVPPGLAPKAYRKCAFLKGDRLQTESRKSGNVINYYANAILHEFGHMNNIFRAGYAHPADGSVMNPAKGVAEMGASLLPFNEDHARQILLATGTQWALQRHFSP